MSKGRHKMVETSSTGPSISRRAMLITPAAGIALAAIVAATNQVGAQSTSAALTIPPDEDFSTETYEEILARKSDLPQVRHTGRPTKAVTRTEKRVEPSPPKNTKHAPKPQTAKPQSQPTAPKCGEMCCWMRLNLIFPVYAGVTPRPGHDAQSII